MTTSTTVKLTREIRFGLHETPAPGATNGFAGNPALIDLAPFLMLRATVSGAIDPNTGMLINIKLVDAVLREHAVPMLRRAYYHEKLPATRAVPPLLHLLAEKFAPHRLESIDLALSPFLTLTATSKEPHMVRLSQRFEFSAAHRLHSDTLSEKENWDIFGRCNNPNGHGHNYELEVTIAGTPGATGEIVAIPELQKIVKERVIDIFDHKHLNLDCSEFKAGTGLNPTVENIAQVIFGKLKDAIPHPAKLLHVRVWETPKTVAEFGE
jgi:6-pyruvoyltetrahydropterin/6-carboxytetrahydropterin synthase